MLRLFKVSFVDRCIKMNRLSSIVFIITFIMKRNDKARDSGMLDVGFYFTFPLF